jgi:hypothetical protein
MLEGARGEGGHETTFIGMDMSGNIRALSRKVL